MAKWKAMLLVSCAACARPVPAPAAPSEARTTTTVSAHLPPADPCLASIDLRELLGRHAAAFGSEAQVEALSPRRVSAVVTMQGSAGTEQVTTDRDHFSSIVRVGGFAIQSGFAAEAWMLGPSGVV